ncbi:MAG TPA: PspC domain-containing protein [Acidimicrobiales bacterium]|nr:PspC domain-containing protein [Acidimicrobiales bacterium]
MSIAKRQAHDQDMVNPTDTTTPDRSRPLRRSGEDRMLAGVAAGIADWFGVDVTAVRVAFVVLAVLGGAGIPLYLAAWLLIPEEGAELSVAEELLHRTRLH